MKRCTAIRFLSFISLILVGIMSISCDRDRTENKPVRDSGNVFSSTDRLQDTLLSAEKTKAKEPKSEPPPLPTFYLDSMASQKDVDSFLTRFSEEEERIIFALNRMDPHRLKKGTRIVLPDTMHTNIMAYTPFPAEMKILDSIPRTILIAQRIQGIALYEHGRLIRWGPISSGKQSTPTPNGIYYGNHKSKRKVSTVNSSWIMPYYFNYMNFEGVGVHQYSMPGYPASHACVRLQEDDAKFIYDWADQWKLSPDGQEVVRNGTPFMVFGTYNFKGLAPWLRLAEDHESNFLTDAEKDTLRNYVERYFNDARNFDPVPDEKVPSKITSDRLKTIQ